MVLPKLFAGVSRKNKTKRPAFADVTNKSRTSHPPKRTRKSSSSKGLRPKPRPEAITYIPYNYIPSTFFTSKVYEVDERDSEDPNNVTDYVVDLYSYFREKEESTAPQHFILERQPTITAEFRAIVIDWMVEVQLYFRLANEALYLAVNIMDRFLMLNERVPRKELQLVAGASLMIAAKFEHRSTIPSVERIAHMCADAYLQQEVVTMEERILKTLKYDLHVPTSYTFLVLYLKAARAKRGTCTVARYVLESTLVSCQLLAYLPSQVASAAICIALYSTGQYPWSPTLCEYTGYCEEAIIHVARFVRQERENALFKQLTAVDRKYNYKRAST